VWKNDDVPQRQERNAFHGGFFFVVRHRSLSGSQEAAKELVEIVSTPDRDSQFLIGLGR
jgi:hypothetical protein